MLAYIFYQGIEYSKIKYLLYSLKKLSKMRNTRTNLVEGPLINNVTLPPNFERYPAVVAWTIGITQIQVEWAMRSVDRIPLEDI